MSRPAHPIVACFRDPDSVGAVQLGELLATTLGQPLVIVSAYEYEPVGLSARVLPDRENERRHDAAVERVARVRRLVHSKIDVQERVVPAERTADALVDLAAEVDAAAIVVGRDLQSNVTRSVLGDARCPVVVAPFTVALGRLEPLEAVGAADDGSSGAQLAVIAAERLAAVAGGEMRRLSEPADAAARLVESTRTLDLLSCGSRGRGRMLGAILGSVSAELVGSAHCPVLVVPAQAGRDDDAPLGVTTAGP